MNTRGLFSLKPPRCIYSMFSEDMALVKYFFCVLIKGLIYVN